MWQGVMEMINNRSVTVDHRYFEQLLLLTSQKACLDHFLGDTVPNGVYCNSTWDNIYCWPPTPAGYDIFLPCPEHLGFDGTKILAYRVCNDHGEWEPDNWTNYTACINYPIPPDVTLLFAVRDIYFVGSSISLVLLVATFFIFCYFRRLHCDRIRIHKHLVMSLILRFIVLIVLLQPYLGINGGYDNSYLNSPIVCRSMVVLSQYFSMTNVFWMLIEGLFLYMRCVVAVFHYISSLTVFYVIGWVVPVCFVLAWTVVMAMFDERPCWLDYSELPYAWIVSGPIVLALVVNLYVLLHILAVLVTKLNADQRVPNYSEHLKALKALFVLLPLLGLTNVLFFVDPKDGGVGEAIFQVFNAVTQASQGIFVSMIYCFTNAEVQTVIHDKLAVIRMKNSLYGNGSTRPKKTDNSTLTTQAGARV